MVALAPAPARAARARAGDLVLVRPAARGASGARDRARDRAPGRGARRDRGADARPRAARASFDPEVEREARAARVRAWRGARGGSGATCASWPTFTIDPASARDFDDAISAEALGEGRVRVWVHIADVAAHVPGGLARRPRGAPARHQRVRAGRGRADAAARALERRLLAGARRASAPAVTVELELRGARGRARGLLPLADPLGRAPGLRARGPDLRRARDAPRSPGAQPLQAAREAAAALAASARAQRRARGRLRGARVRVRRAGQRQRDPRPRADRVPPPDRAPDDRRQRGGRAACSTQRGVPCLYRVHERPEPERDRAAGRAARLAGGAHAAAARAHVRVAGGRARGRDLSARRAATCAAAAAGGSRSSSLVLRSLKQAYYSPTQPRPRGPALAELLPLHLADPPLPRPRLPPRAALRRRGRASPRRAPASWPSSARGPPNASARR